MMQDRSIAAQKVVKEPVRPTDATGRELISIRGLLEWAFAVECAQLDFDEVRSVGHQGSVGFGMEYRIAQQLELGKSPGEGVRVDTSFGRSLPHDDAELVATAVRNNLHWWEAVSVADYARTGTCPKWDLGPAQVFPREWGKSNQNGRLGKREQCDTYHYRMRGRARSCKIYWTPITWSPSPNDIAAARRKYLDWYGALLSVRVALKNTYFDRFALTSRMPQRTPWKKQA